MNAQDHRDVLTLCWCVAEAWARGDYQRASEWAELDDRASDCWEPLCAVAELPGVDEVAS